MPIVDVQIVSRDSAPERDTLAQELADALGACLEVAPGRAWVRLHMLPASRYAENGVVLTMTELPVFVRVLHARLPEGEALHAQARRIAQAVASVSGRPAAHVHIEFAPAGAGRIAFGGKVLE